MGIKTFDDAPGLRGPKGDGVTETEGPVKKMDSGGRGTTQKPPAPMVTPKTPGFRSPGQTDRLR